MIGTHTGPGILGVAGLRTELLGPCSGRRIRRGAAGTTARGGRPARSSRSAARAPTRPGRPGAHAADHRPRRCSSRSSSRSSLYLIYLLRKPIGWVLIATFLAVALSGPVNVLNQCMRRGFAITIVYFGLLLIPIGIARADHPAAGHAGQQPDPGPARVRAGRPGLRPARTRACAGSKRTTTSPRSCRRRRRSCPRGSATRPSVLGDIGLGVVNSLFALFTILDDDRVPARQRARLGRPRARAAARRRTRRACARRSTTWARRSARTSAA